MSQRSEVQIDGSKVKNGVLRVDKETTVPKPNVKDSFFKSFFPKLFPDPMVTQLVPVHFTNFDRIPVNSAQESLRLTLPDSEELMQYRISVKATERVLVDCQVDTNSWKIIFLNSANPNLPVSIAVNVTIQPDEDDDLESGNKN